MKDSSAIRIMRTVMVRWCGVFRIQMFPLFKIRFQILEVKETIRLVFV